MRRRHSRSKRPFRPSPTIYRLEALDPDKEGNERTLDVHISRLRKKLGTAGKQIATVWNIGYRLEQE